MLSLLDALIRLDAEIPEGALFPTAEDYPDQVAILLLRNPDTSHKDLLRFIDLKHHSRSWHAVTSTCRPKPPHCF